MTPVRIKSDGTICGTKIFVAGVELKNVKSLRLEGDAEGDTLHLTLFLFPGATDIEVDGQVDISERPASVRTGSEVA